MINKKWLMLALALIIIVCVVGIYFVIFPPGNSDALKQARQEVETLRQQNDLYLENINTLSQKLNAVQTKYEAERRGRLEAVEKKYTDLNPGDTVDALNAITARARQRRLETVSGRDNPD